MVPKLFFLESVALCGLLAGALVFSQGAVRVEVRPKAPGGKHIYVIAPAIVLPVGAMLVPAEKVRQAGRDIQPWLPTIRAATEDLLREPDATLVQVDNSREHVKIAKAGDALVIDVDDEGETVHVSVPLRAAAYACNELAEKSRYEPEAPRHSAS